LHHVFPDEEVHFRALLGVLARDHTFISYSEAAERIAQGRIDRPYLAFSMDDGLKSCRRAAAILCEFDVRGCFFVITSMIGESHPDKIRRFCATKLDLPPVEFMTWADAEAMRSEGHEIGSHSSTHQRLSKLNAAELVDEITQSRDVLRRRVGEAVHFAWPYGSFSDISAQAANAVFDAGLSSLASGVRGCHLAGGPPIPLQQLRILREHCEVQWPAAHTLFFLARRSALASSERRFRPAVAGSRNT
jgi:peptidoglycan/xylan/chitin deacetylase (PgdA/CDA1 family)